MPLQIVLLRKIAHKLSQQTTEMWWTHIQGTLDSAHVPFSMLAMCHYVKQSFAAFSDMYEHQQNFGHNPELPKFYRQMIAYVDTHLRDIDCAVEQMNLGNYDKPGGDYKQLCLPSSPSPSNKRPKTNSSASSSGTSPIDLTSDQSGQRGGSSRSSGSQGNFGQGFLVGRAMVPPFPSGLTFCHKFAKTNLSCNRNPCQRAHVTWDRLSDDQKTEIATTVHATPNLDLVRGCEWTVPSNRVCSTGLLPAASPTALTAPAAAPRQTQVVRAPAAPAAPTPAPAPAAGTWGSGWGKQPPSR